MSCQVFQKVVTRLAVTIQPQDITCNITYALQKWIKAQSSWLQPKKTVQYSIRNNLNNTGQRPMLAHPVAPLAACVQRQPCTENMIAMARSFEKSKN